MVWRATDPQGNEADKVRFDVVPYMGQSNVDLGCGPAKVWPHFLGVCGCCMATVTENIIALILAV